MWRRRCASPQRRVLAGRDGSATRLLEIDLGDALVAARAAPAGSLHPEGLRRAGGRAGGHRARRPSAAGRQRASTGRAGVCGHRARRSDRSATRQRRGPRTMLLALGRCRRRSGIVMHTGRITRPLTPGQTPGFAGHRRSGWRLRGLGGSLMVCCVGRGFETADSSPLHYECGLARERRRSPSTVGQPTRPNRACTMGHGRPPLGGRGGRDIRVLYAGGTSLVVGAWSPCPPQRVGETGEGAGNGAGGGRERVRRRTGRVRITRAHRAESASSDRSSRS